MSETEIIAPKERISIIQVGNHECSAEEDLRNPDGVNLILLPVLFRLTTKTILDL